MCRHREHCPAGAAVPRGGRLPPTPRWGKHKSPLIRSAPHGVGVSLMSTTGRHRQSARPGAKPPETHDQRPFPFQLNHCGNGPLLNSEHAVLPARRGSLRSTLLPSVRARFRNPLQSKEPRLELGCSAYSTRRKGGKRLINCCCLVVSTCNTIVRKHLDTPVT